MGQRSPSYRIFMYHRIASDANAVAAGYWQAGMAVLVEDFVSQIRTLKQGSTVLGLEQLVSSFARGNPPSGNACALTFDDGFIEHHQIVLPILREFGLTATFFVNGNCWPHLRRPRWIDTLYAIIETASPERRRLRFAVHGESLDIVSWPTVSGMGVLKQTFRAMDPQGRDKALLELATALDVIIDERALCDGLYLDRQMIAEMRIAGMTIGAHTLTHPDLNRISLADAEHEVQGSRKLVADIVGESIVPFAYPFGGLDSYSPEITRLVADAGFSCACTSVEDVNTIATPPFELRRMAVGPSMLFAEATAT